MPTCPHCGQPIRAEHTHCPHCGTALSGVWPPAPTGQEAGLPPPDPDEARQQVNDGAGTGCVIGAAIYLLLAFFTFGYVYTGPARKMRVWHLFCYGVPLLTLSVWQWFARRKAPFFARGLIYSLLGIVACLLGALAVCREAPH